MFYSCKTSHNEISVSCTTELCDVVTTPNYPIFAPLFVKWSLTGGKTQKKILVAVAYERWSLASGPKYSDLTWKLLVFWKTGGRGEVVAYERWLQPEVRPYTNSQQHL